MGIPAYFSNLIKEHSDILKKFNFFKLKVDFFYLDSNSIIYDCLKNANYDEFSKTNNFTIVYQLVYEKLNTYINILKPTNIFIAFDGVAPLAKMDQQRTRRYKSSYQNKITQSLNNDKKDNWNTAIITPGTDFMNGLNKFLSEKYRSKGNIILSLSNSPGEGEHKIFQHLRSNHSKLSKKNIVIYGLDSDLIMLSLNHIKFVKKLYLFRETPEFIKSINFDLEPNENYIMDIPLLAYEINKELNINLDELFIKDRLDDYIFICFMLGNDFLPHFPSINIRTGGINKLINAYKNIITNSHSTIISNDTIQWDIFKKFISFLADNELQYLIEENKNRSKYELKYHPDKTIDDKLYNFNLLPSKNREVEKHINIGNKNWEERYYKYLFEVNIDDMRRKQICINYLEGLEWTFKYYKQDCIDWRWKYFYHYPPLLKDLVHFIPFYNNDLLAEKNFNPVTEITQLSYVLPRDSLNLLPINIKENLLTEIPHIYKNDCRFNWAFCKYFWESHVDLPFIDIEDLENILL